MNFIIATNNEHKLKELERILSPLGINAKSPKELGISLGDVEENGETFADNAYLKAYAACGRSGLPAIADDSGLCVDALGGRPGVFSARYDGENATDRDKIKKLLKELDGVPSQERTARFVCSVCCVFPNRDKITAEGKCEGKIALEPDGNGGFGYDPVFLYNGVSFGRLTAEKKDSVSHRGNALREFREVLKVYLEEKNVNK